MAKAYWIGIVDVKNHEEYKKYADIGTKLKVKILNSFWECEIVEDSPYDPSNANIRVDG